MDFLRNFLEKLQSADEGRKTTWLVAGTAVITIFVIFVWLKYFGSLIAPAATEQNGKSPAGAFWETFRSGLSVIYGETKEQIQNTKEKIQSPADYEIKSK